MKNRRCVKILVYLLCFILFVSCGQNKIKTNEKALSKQILTEEQQLTQEAALREKREQQLADSIAKLPTGIRLKEERGCDKQMPPKLINIADLFNNRNDRENVVLSDLVKKITYVPLEDIEGKSFFEKTEDILLTDKYIVVSGLGGLFLYNRDGVFQEVVCRTEMPSGNSGYKGVWGKASVVENNLYYRFADNSAQKHFLMKFDLATLGQTVLMPDMVEKYQITGKGKIIASLSTEKGKRFAEYVPLGQHCFAGYNSKIHSAQSGKLMTSFRNDGDTLCNFSDNEILTNYSQTLMRGNFSQNSYQYNNTFTFLNAFSDTVFRVMPPNRLLPVYVLQMGNYKITQQEGFSPGIDISSKLYVDKFTETSKRIFLKIKQGYDSSENRKKQQLSVYFAIYEKNNGVLKLLSVNPVGYYLSDTELHQRQGITNDLDGGLLFWPEKVSSSGEMYQVIRGKELKKHIFSAEFKRSAVPQDRKDELVAFVKQLKSEQLLLIIYK